MQKTCLAFFLKEMSILEFLNGISSVV